MTLWCVQYSETTDELDHQAKLIHPRRLAFTLSTRSCHFLPQPARIMPQSCTTAGAFNFIFSYRLSTLKSDVELINFVGTWAWPTGNQKRELEKSRGSQR